VFFHIPILHEIAGQARNDGSVEYSVGVKCIPRKCDYRLLRSSCNTYGTFSNITTVTIMPLLPNPASPALYIDKKD
ncbi:MAG: hypothetical protein FWH55_12670, partial [Oscillospiraceae bacterium]|nr:hypothetical protein [Oscillospiraceae bacterium]